MRVRCRFLLLFGAVHFTLQEKKIPTKTPMFDTSTQHKMDPVKFVSRVQNLKLTRETGSNTNNENYEREINKVTRVFLVAQWESISLSM